MAATAFSQADTWTVRSPMPTPRRLLAAAVEEGKAYTFGGCGSPCFQPPFHVSTFEETRVEVYDPRTDSWSARGRMPHVLYGGAAAAPGSGKIYTVGGFVGGDVVQEYDPATDRWVPRASMPTPRHGLAAVALEGRVYALGGSTGSRASDALEVYDPRTDTWERLEPMPTPRVFLATAVLEGRIYAMGGSPDCCGASRTDVVEVYDPTTDSWSSAAPLPWAQQGSAAAELNGRILTFGGFVPGEGAHGRTFEYDRLEDRWTERSPMPTARDQAPAVGIDSLAFVLGGSIDCHCQALDPTEVYTPSPPPGMPESDIGIFKTNGTDVLPEGFPTEYVITVHNFGPDPAFGIRVRDDLPNELRDARWTCTGENGGVCSAAGAGSIDDSVDLPTDGSVIYRLQAVVEAGEPQPSVSPAPADPPELPVTNEASATLPRGIVDPDPRNNTAVDVDTVESPSADLGISESLGSPGPVLAGESVSFKVVVTNRGPQSVAGAHVRGVLPNAFESASWTCQATAGARCTASGLGDIDDSVDLPVGGTITFTLVAKLRIDFLGPLTNAASITPPSGVNDPAGADNVSTASVMVFPLEAGVHAIKNVAGAFVEGGEVVYALVLLSTSAPQDESELGDAFPPELLLTGAEATSGQVARNGNQLSWTGTVAAFTPVTITARAQVRSGTAGTPICNLAFVDGAPSDDPAIEGLVDPTCFTPRSPLFAIPTLSHGVQGLLVLLLLMAGVAKVRWLQ